MDEVQQLVLKETASKGQVWSDLLKKAPPPWRDKQQFLDVGDDLIALMQTPPEVILPPASLQNTTRGSINLIMNHYFFPEIPVITSILEQWSQEQGKQKVVTAVSAMPPKLVIPDSYPVHIPPQYYYHRYSKQESAWKNVTGGPEWFLYWFNQLGFVGGDKALGADKMSNQERNARNFASAQATVSALEGQNNAIIYPSGDRMPGPQHPGFIGWTVLEQYLLTDNNSPINFWVHDGMLPADLIKLLTSKKSSPFQFFSVDTLTSDQVTSLVRNVIDGRDKELLELMLKSDQTEYLSLVRILGMKCGVELIREFNRKADSEYQRDHPDFNWDRFLKLTRSPLREV